MRTTYSIPNVRTISLIGGLIALFSALERDTLAQGTVCPDNGTVRVCLQWSRVTPPQVDADFQMSFSSSGPEIVLRSGDLEWVVYAEVMATGEPADIASLTIDPSSSTENFVVTLADGNTAGAANVGSIDLTATAWSGHSSLAGGTINGDLTGDLVLRRVSGVGGALTRPLNVNGLVYGNITIPVIDGQDAPNNGCLKLFGGIASTASISITDRMINSALLSIETDIPAGSEITVNRLLDDARLEATAEQCAAFVTLPNGISGPLAHVSLRNLTAPELLT